MAERRMFTKKITESDAFLDMPLSAQALYFHINMAADDEGFVNNPRKIQRMINASDDDYNLLIMKSFLIAYDSGVIVVKHWKMHNYIQKDRFHPTVYQEEKRMLKVKENGSYTLDVNGMDTTCIQNGYRMDTEVRLGKDSIGKVNNNMSDSRTALGEIFEKLYKPYPKKKGKKIDAKNKFIAWCTTGCVIKGEKKRTKYTPDQIAQGMNNYAKTQDPNDFTYWMNIDTLMNNIYNYIEVEDGSK